MCLYVYGIQANMHWIQLLCERRYMHIHAYTCRYIDVCITYTSCKCDMVCVISRAYVVHMQAVCPSHTYTYINPYVCCMCFRYIHICIGRITDVPILHAEHPVLLAFNKEAPGNAFVLAPRKTTQKNSVLYGEDPGFRHFQELFCVSFVASRANERPS